MDKNNNKSILEDFESFLNSENLHYQWTEDKKSIALNNTGINGSYRFIARMSTKKNIFILYSMYPIKVTEDKEKAISEFINRSNYNRLIGRFEFNYDEGEIFYTTTLDFEKITLYDNSIFENLFWITFSSMDKYLPAILGVLYGNKTPKEAIEEIENEDKDKKKVNHDICMN